MKNGNVKRTKVPLILNLVFVYCTRETLNTMVKKPSPPSEIVKLYLKKRSSTILRPSSSYEINPKIMSNFIKATRIDNTHTMMVNPDRRHFKIGDYSKVVCGDFRGVAGQMARAAGQQRIVVELNGIGYVLTA